MNYVHQPCYDKHKMWCRLHEAAQHDLKVDTYLVAMSMTANDNGLCPARDETWNGFTDNGFTEHGTSENVTDRTIRTQPHLLQLEFWKCNKKYVQICVAQNTVMSVWKDLLYALLVSLVHIAVLVITSYNGYGNLHTCLALQFTENEIIIVTQTIFSRFSYFQFY